MTIMNRFIKLCKADIHGVMDEIEDKGLLLKQCIRDMETALAEKKARLEQMTSARARAEKEFAGRRAELEKTEADVKAAIEKQRDDIARMLIKKATRLNHHQAEMKRHLSTLKEEADLLQDTIDCQQHELEAVKLQAATFFHRREMKVDSTCGYSSAPPPEPSEEEIELELIRRKDALKGGGA